MSFRTGNSHSIFSIILGAFVANAYLRERTGIDLIELVGSL